MEKTKITRPPLASLACAVETCDLYGQVGQNNLTIRKMYGRDQIRYLRCRACRQEFSERKNTALWNSKIDEARAVSIAEHLSEGCSLKSTARLVKADVSTIKRLNRRLGEHGQTFHDQQVSDVAVKALQADERHGFAVSKQQPQWEAEVIDPESKFVLAHVQGRRNETLIRSLLTDAQQRLAAESAQDFVLFTDGEPNYASLFPELFGTPYRPARQGSQGRLPKVRHRIPRRLAHVQVIKHRTGHKLQSVEIRHRHGSVKRVNEAVAALGHNVPNTAIIERRNGTARLMNITQVRKTLAFSRNPDAKEALGWWTLTVYNWCREHRMLRQELEQPVGKKSMSSGRQRWRLV
mgnify:CR=1 FL=1